MMKIRDVLAPARKIFANRLEAVGSLGTTVRPRPLIRYILQSNHGLPNVGLRTMSTQPELARLPVPPLQDTLDKFLKSTKPLLTDEEFANTTNIVKEFACSGGEGETLHKLLEERAKSTENWLTEWWLNTAYLEFRWPVVIFSSPGLVFPLQKFNSIGDQLAYTAKLISAALDYNMIIDENKIPPEKMGKDPLDMSQYFKIFGTCRIPGVTRDTLSYFDKRNPPKHILVMHNNHVNVFGEKMEPLNETQILCQIEEVVQKSLEPATPVGVLTSENRNVWGKTYEMLRKDELNACSLSQIATARFVVCIDNKDMCHLKPANAQTGSALRMLHGGGSKGNSGNRWFDKTVQFVIGQEGHVGLTYEHSPAEGPPIAMLMDHIVKFLEQKKPERLPAEKTKPPERLCFNVSPEMEQIICKAEKNIDILVEDLHLIGFTFSSFGKDFIKSQKVSPDSFIQMAMQLAFYRLHCVPAAHYESASQRKFLHGRTETIRSCSVESVHFAKTMLGEASAAEKKKAMVEAINAHKAYTISAVSGLAVDRPLLGLKLAALEKGLPVPKFFSDTGYTRSSHFRISSSQVAAKCDAFMCYAPLVPDGYGCCYNPRDKEIVFGASSFRACAATDTTKFRNSLETSLMDMHNVLLEAGTKSKL